MSEIMLGLGNFFFFFFFYKKVDSPVGELQTRVEFKN